MSWPRRLSVAALRSLSACVWGCMIDRTPKCRLKMMRRRIVHRHPKQCVQTHVSVSFAAAAAAAGAAAAAADLDEQKKKK